jgi:hydroxypyruvate isomerase
MLPKEFSYVDRFKLALDCGFQGVEANTVYDLKEAEAIREAAAKTGLADPLRNELGSLEISSL